MHVAREIKQTIGGAFFLIHPVTWSQIVTKDSLGKWPEIVSDSLG